MVGRGKPGRPLCAVSRPIQNLSFDVGRLRAVLPAPNQWPRRKAMSDERRILTREGKVLLQAAELVERHGWCRGEATNAAGQVCAVEAIARVSEHEPDRVR